MAHAASRCAGVHALCKFVAALLCGLLASATWAAAPTGLDVPNYQRIQLRNGAVLLLMERRDVPLVTFSALLRGGSAVDAPGKSGTASVLAELLERGAGQRDAFAFADAIAAVGGSIQVAADVESIAINGSFLANDEALMVELLSDMLQRPALPAAEFENVRARQIDFLRAAKDTELNSLAPIYGAAQLFGPHPYGRPIDGSEASLAALTHNDVLEYYQQQFGADRLILAVAGDFRTAIMRRLLTQALSSWRKAPTRLPTIPAPAPVRQRSVLLIDAPESAQSYFWLGNVGVARSDPRRAALDVINTLFGGRFTSMLNTELRIRSGLSYGASSGFRRLAQPGSWQLSSFTRTETTVEAIDLALSVLDRLHTPDALDEAMLQSARSYVLGQYPLSFETAAQWASHLAMLELYGLDQSYIEDYGPTLAAVTLEEARNAAASVIPRSNALVLTVIGRADALREALAKYGQVTELKLSAPHFGTE